MDEEKKAEIERLNDAAKTVRDFLADWIKNGKDVPSIAYFLVETLTILLECIEKEISDE